MAKQKKRKARINRRDAYRREVTNNLAVLNQVIADYMAGNTQPRPAARPLKDDHFKSVLFGLGMMIDDIVEARTGLHQQARFNRLRVEMWKLASDESLAEEQLIQRVLETIGPEFGVCRVCYNRLIGSDFTCTQEWCRPGVKPSVGMKMPAYLVKLFLKKEFQIITKDTLAGKVPARLKAVVQPFIDYLADSLDLEALAAVPCYFDGKLEGVITFDASTGRGKSLVWSKEKSLVIEDLVKIFTGTISHRRMEKEIVTAKAALEERVKARTEELQRANRRLKVSLDEKEVLLKEIHHRVKNNLQTVSSLLNLQARYIQDQHTLGLFKDCQSRIKSIGLVHERLYQSEDLAHIDFSRYAEGMVRDLFSMYVERSTQITSQVEIKVPDLRVDTAIPCGLIINELVSNALKYAFPDGRKGAIAIRMTQERPGRCRLLVSDDGVGLPENVDFSTTDSLGLQLVRTLTDQINGRITIDRQQGTAYQILFKL